jgi:putative transposase
VRDLAVLVLHLLVTIARFLGPGGARAVVAESVLVRHQLLILNRNRKRSPNLRLSDRIVAGLCALLMRPGRLIRSAIVLKPSTLIGVERTSASRRTRQITDPSLEHPPGGSSRSRKSVVSIIAMSGAQRKRPIRPSFAAGA